MFRYEAIAQEEKASRLSRIIQIAVLSFSVIGFSTHCSNSKSYEDDPDKYNGKFGRCEYKESFCVDIANQNIQNASKISIEEAYKILNLDIKKNITKDDVKNAYIKIQKKIHPDISPETTRLSTIVNEAKEIVLKDIS